MQSNASRIALVVIALVIAVAAFLVLRPGDDGERQAPTTAGQVEETDTAAGGGAAKEDKDGGASARADAGGESRPEVPTIEIRDGDVVGGVEEIQVEQGDEVEFVVESDTDDEIHVHGYELTEQVGRGDPARFSFPADLEGIYEVEAHDIGDVVVAELRVTPS